MSITVLQQQALRRQHLSAFLADYENELMDTSPVLATDANPNTLDAAPLERYLLVTHCLTNPSEYWGTNHDLGDLKRDILHQQDAEYPWIPDVIWDLDTNAPCSYDLTVTITHCSAEDNAADDMNTAAGRT